MPPTLRHLGNVADGRIRKRWQIIAPGGPIRKVHSRTKGLDNPGLLCYRNATLQCLLHVPELFNYLCRQDRCNTPGDNCVFCTLRTLALSYWSSIETSNPASAHAFPQAVVADLNTAMNQHQARNPMDPNPYDFLRSQVTNVLDINASGQQDAHEYFLGVSKMLKHINNDFLHTVNGIPVKNTAINRLFQMKIKKSWTCRDCGRVSVRQDPSVGMQLPMNRPPNYVANNRINLSWYLADYFTPERLDSVRCDSEACMGRAAHRERISKIAVAPEILVIQLVRMQMDLYGRLRKVRHQVAYDELVDLSAYTEKDAPLRYQFTGAVLHRGAAPSQGHYIANVRCQNGVDFAEANDSDIDVLAKSTALRDDQKFQSYLLMYQKVGGKMAKCI